MLAAALRDGSANRPTTFEVFARRLPTGRRYGVVAGTGRLLEALPQFRFDADACELLAQFLDPATVRYLREFRFRGDIDGYAEGELYFPGSPVLSVRGSFAECVLLETLVLSIFNHDTAIASAAARMVSAAGGRPLIEMGSRRTHERAAVAAARAALREQTQKPTKSARFRSFCVFSAGQARVTRPSSLLAASIGWRGSTRTVYPTGPASGSGVVVEKIS